MKVADAIASILKKEGVQYLFTYPTTPLIDACANIGIRPVLCRQERVGVHMADAYARVTNGKELAVFAMQNGPGVENAFGGIATAYSDSTPMLFIPLGHPRDRSQVFPLFNAAKAFTGITKSFETLTMASETETAMRRAISAVRIGRGGPAMLELPLDVAREEVDPAVIEAYRPTRVPRFKADEQDVDVAVAALLNAKRPIIIAGHGALYAQATAQLIALAERLAIPVMTTLEGKSAFPENHPLSLGCGGLVMPGTVHHFVKDADLVLGVGTSLTKHSMATTIPGSKTLIHITNDSRDFNKSYRTDYPILGDAALVLEQFLDAAGDLRASPRDAAPVVAEIARVHAAWIASWMPKLTSNETPITPYRVIWDIMHTFDPSEMIVTHDSGSPRDQIMPFWKSTRPRGFLGWGKSHALGSGLGMIMGAKMAAPEKFCLQFQGDAAFGQTGLDFETAVRNTIPITTVVLNNNSMATEVHALPVAHERFRVRDIGGTYSGLARDLGGHVETVIDPSQIVEATRRAREANDNGRAALIEVITSHETSSSHRYAF